MRALAPLFFVLLFALLFALALLALAGCDVEVAAPPPDALEYDVDAEVIEQDPSCLSLGCDDAPCDGNDGVDCDPDAGPALACDPSRRHCWCEAIECRWCDGEECES